MLWTYDDLRTTPLAISKPPKIGWRIKIQPQLDGKPFSNSQWRRGDEYLPVLDNLYRQAAGSIQLEAIGGKTAGLIQVTAQNSDSVAHKFSIVCDALTGMPMNNPGWIDPERNPDTLVAAYNELPDRVLLFAIGSAQYPVSKNSITLEWTLQPGESRSGWLVRPYSAYEHNLPQLRTNDWKQEFEAARDEWKELFKRAVSIEIPDREVRNAFYACLGDLFIMREPLADGYMGTICGTEVYRGTNPYEPCIAGIALDQTGFHAAAANGLRVHLEMQEPDGNWADPHGWAQSMWGCEGYKAWSGMEHFKLTGDQSYLKSLFPRLAASSRWQEQQRQKSRNAKAESTTTDGLMPRGMGDAGLMNGTDNYGVFYAQNILAVFADALSVEAAESLGATDQLPELRKIHETALNDLLASMRKGAIHEDDFEWIPDSPFNTTGSRWGALYTLFPTEILTPNDPLLVGTMKKIEKNISAGGQPIHTGWMEDGCWVGITLDNIAETHLRLGNGDQAVKYLYSSLNHGTPLYTWCEERGQEPQTKKTSGDRQHLWTPVAVVRYLRDSLVMEQPDGLHLALATGRSWLEQGNKVGIQNAPTHFGEVSYTIESDVERGVIRAEIMPPTRALPKAIQLHLRHPLKKRMQRVTIDGIETKDFDSERELIRLVATKDLLHVVAYYGA